MEAENAPFGASPPAEIVLTRAAKGDRMSQSYVTYFKNGESC
jgi:hypothetical protein